MSKPIEGRDDPNELGKLRYLLPDPESKKMLSTYRVHGFEKHIVPCGYMAHYLAIYCSAAGIELGVYDFLFKLRQRQALNKPRYTKTRLMRQSKMLQMYTVLYNRGSSKTFTDLLQSLGWWSKDKMGPYQPPTDFVPSPPSRSLPVQGRKRAKSRQPGSTLHRVVDN